MIQNTASELGLSPQQTQDSIKSLEAAFDSGGMEGLRLAIANEVYGDASQYVFSNTGDGSGSGMEAALRSKRRSRLRG